MLQGCFIIPIPEQDILNKRLFGFEVLLNEKAESCGMKFYSSKKEEIENWINLLRTFTLLV